MKNVGGCAVDEGQHAPRLWGALRIDVAQRRRLLSPIPPTTEPATPGASKAERRTGRRGCGAHLPHLDFRGRPTSRPIPRREFERLPRIPGTRGRVCGARFAGGSVLGTGARPPSQHDMLTTSAGPKAAAAGRGEQRRLCRQMSTANHVAPFLMLRVAPLRAAAEQVLAINWLGRSASRRGIELLREELKIVSATSGARRNTP